MTIRDLVIDGPGIVSVLRTWEFLVVGDPDPVSIPWTREFLALLSCFRGLRTGKETKNAERWHSEWGRSICFSGHEARRNAEGEEVLDSVEEYQEIRRFSRDTRRMRNKMRWSSALSTQRKRRIWFSWARREKTWLDLSFRYQKRESGATSCSERCLG